MPRGDGTGPAGRGPMTGRAAGYCTGNNSPGMFNTVRRGNFLRRNARLFRGQGRRPGPGRGMGRGWRR